MLMSELATVKNTAVTFISIPEVMSLLADSTNSFVTAWKEDGVCNTCMTHNTAMSVCNDRNRVTRCSVSY
jgi:hypothetical protein